VSDEQPRLTAAGDPAITLHSLRDRALFVTPIRLALAVFWLVASRLTGAPAAGSALAFASGLLVTCLLLLGDPRSRLLSQREPTPAPVAVQVASRPRQALGALVPSTVGVSILAAVALALQPTLTALLGGICAGLGIAGVLAALRIDPGLYLEPRSRMLYRR
jgi:hypothetical protein